MTKEKEKVEGRVKESEERLGLAKAGRLEAESKLLQAEVSHASCGSHIANLLDSAERAKRELKEKEEGWLSEREKLVESISEGFNTGIDQLKVFLQGQYPSLGIDWETVTVDDILAFGFGEEGESERKVEGSGVEKGGGDEAKGNDGEGREETTTEGTAKAGVVIIEELN